MTQVKSGLASLFMLMVGFAVFLVYVRTLGPLPAAAAEATAEAMAAAEYFTVEPAEIERGEEVTLRWSVRGAERVMIQQYYGHPTKTAADVVYEDLPPTGELTVKLDYSQPTEYTPARPYIYWAGFILAQRTQAPEGYSGLYPLGSDSVQIRCPDIAFFFGLDELNYEFCPLTPETQEIMVYQPFEKGFMIWRKETDTVYVFSTSGRMTDGPAVALPLLDCADQQKAYACAPSGDMPEWFTTMQTALDQPPPAGLYRPAAVMEAPRRYHGLAQTFGWATAPEVEYTATVQETYGDTFASDVAYMTLPDCRVIVYAQNLYTSDWNLVQDQGCS
ncbi:MAG TPA: hypothetical protein VHO69_19095 [Phototrophicaceae bacterium]|nr:hypothetical protein [Phototrophicaceae bacterium]